MRTRRTRRTRSRRAILKDLRRAYRLYAQDRPSNLANVVAEARKAGVPESEIQRIKSEAFRRYARR